MERLNVDLGERSYDIVFTDSFDNLGDEAEKINIPQKLLIVTDTNVKPLYADSVKEELEKIGAEVGVYAIPAGEENKNMGEILKICSACIENKLDRKSMIVALGGGVVGDMAGFAASIYMRGIDFIQIPTTLLSQSDSSVGGKTGIDFADSKNILGAFHQPKLVYINVNTLKTLPEEQFVSGMGEVIKHGIIKDSEFFDYIKNNSGKIKTLDADTFIQMSKTNCTIKADVVVQDEKENGLRAILNFGHTIGHAVESAFDFKLTHGECVGLGMIAVSNIAVERGIIEKSVLNDIENVLLEYGFRTKIKLPQYESIMSFMQKDKKKQSGKLKFVLPVKIGDVVQVNDVTDNEIYNALEFINKR